MSPKGFETRPIPDRVKESVFGMLGVRVEGASVVDLFAGTGSVGLEALSRGARQCMFVEQDREAAAVLERNIALLGCEGKCKVVKGDALGLSVAARCPRPVDLVFFDPPYPIVLDHERCGHVLRQFGRFVDMLGDDGFAILRTPWPFRHLRVYDQQGLEIPFGDERNPFDVLGRVRKDRPPPSGKRHLGEHRHVYSEGERRKREEKEEAGESSWELDDIDLEAIQADTDEQEMLDAIAELGPSRGLKILREDVDLKLANAVGPETHVYASMGVHLYMRRK